MKWQPVIPNGPQRLPLAPDDPLWLGVGDGFLPSIGLFLPEGGEKDSNRQDRQDNDDAPSDRAEHSAHLAEPEPVPTQGLDRRGDKSGSGAIQQEFAKLGRFLGRMHEAGLDCTGWSARIPMDPEFLNETVLRVTCRDAAMELFFECNDFGVKTFLNAHRRTVEDTLIQSLGSRFDITLLACP